MTEEREGTLGQTGSMEEGVRIALSKGNERKKRKGACPKGTGVCVPLISKADEAA